MTPSPRENGEVVNMLAKLNLVNIFPVIVNAAFRSPERKNISDVENNPNVISICRI